MFVLSVGVGNEEFVTVCRAAYDIGDARGENAGLAGQFFIDDVGNAVADSAQHWRRRTERRSGQRSLFVDVMEPEARFLTAIAAAADATCGQRVSPTELPVGKYRAGRFVHRSAGVDQAEKAAAFQIAAHDAGQRTRQTGFADKVGNGHRNAVGTGTGDFDRQLGMRRRQKKSQGGAGDQTDFAQ